MKVERSWKPGGSRPAAAETQSKVSAFGSRPPAQLTGKVHGDVLAFKQIHFIWMLG